MVDYLTNSQMEWHLFEEGSYPAHGQEVWILLEEDTCDAEIYPLIRRARAEKVARLFDGIMDVDWAWTFYLFDWDDELDDAGHRGKPYLNANFYSVQAWRAMTKTS